MDDPTMVSATAADGAAAPPASIFEAVDVSKRYHSSKATIDVLQDLDMALCRGETLAVVGASGIGKSTLLHILGTLDRPDQGKILYKGNNVLEYDDQRLANFRNRTMGFIFQFHHLLPEFSALENAMMPALIQGMAHPKAVDIAEKILDRVGLSHRMHQKATALSGGEQQRVALARALVLKPAILFADEPTGNLDEKNAEQVHELLLGLNAEMGMAVIAVTHNMALASLMGRRATITLGRLVYM
jgi:lipoprotein-releasing system ATP-binding protein